jgi:hypothetical protein
MSFTLRRHQGQRHRRMPQVRGTLQLIPGMPTEHKPICAVGRQRLVTQFFGPSPTSNSSLAVVQHCYNVPPAGPTFWGALPRPESC